MGPFGLLQLVAHDVAQATELSASSYQTYYGLLASVDSPPQDW